MTGAEYREKMIRETLEFHGLKRWHEAGYTGKGIKFLELEDPESNHGQYVTMVSRWAAPGLEAHLGALSYHVSGKEILSLRLRLADRTLEGNEAIAFMRSMDIIGASVSGGLSPVIEDLLRSLGVIIGCSAGNDGSTGVTGKYKDVGFSIGALYQKDGKIYREGYSACGDDELDFTTFHMDREGTSFSFPTWVGIVAVIKEKYPNLTMENAEAVLKSISVDLGALGYDTDFGWGAPVLPADLTIDLLEDKTPPAMPTPELGGGEDVVFPDTEKHWAQEAIDRVTSAGLMQGFKDGTFKPDMAMTRAEAATIIDRITQQK